MIYLYLFYVHLKKLHVLLLSKEGVKFQSPHDGQEMLLTPEKSTEIQNSIGADIIMQLDDVVSSTTTGDRTRLKHSLSLTYMYNTF